jgi:hypothetical protein
MRHATEATRTAFEGMQLRDDLAQELESSIADAPDNLSPRLRLLGYYLMREFESDAARQARQRHILWLIAHHPEWDVLVSPVGFLQIDLNANADVINEAKRLWMQKVDAHPQSAQVLGNAAKCLLFNGRDDEALVQQLLEAAQLLDPEEPEWPENLGLLCNRQMREQTGDERRQTAGRGLEQFERAYRLTDGVEKLLLLSNMASAALEAGALDTAREYAASQLETAPEQQHTNCWNYGNALYHGNVMLGRVALREGDVESAKRYLLEAGKTPGSPQLKSYGPEMSLARELLERDERQVVIDFIHLCREFWELGRDRLAEWIAVVQRQQVPDFSGSVDR